jgi:hypothetical protein
MEKKKNRKKKDKKIAAKTKAREKAKELKAKLKEKAKKEKTKVKLKEKAKKEKTKDKDKVKAKAKVKKSKTKGNDPVPVVRPETGKDKNGTPGKAVSEASTAGTSSLSVNVPTAISRIKSLTKIEAINKYTSGDERITVRRAATSRITGLAAK